jgi:hypothetical protein
MLLVNLKQILHAYEQNYAKIVSKITYFEQRIIIANEIIK